MEEIWKLIENYEENYAISNKGRVKNIKTNKILVGDINNFGYKRVYLYTPIRKRFFIHRLVAYHFVDGYAESLVVNHKDGNKQNNCADNLEWVSRSENDLHAYKNNLRYAHEPNQKGDIVYQVFDLNTFSVIKEYTNKKDFFNDYWKMSQETFRHACNRQWFFKDWHNKKLGKVGIKKIHKNVNKSSTTIETIE